MNERIKLLADKALDKAVPYTWTTLSYDEVTKLQEKFAELIIRECIGQVEVFNVRMDARPRHIIEAIKEHFGVEE